MAGQRDVLDEFVGISAERFACCIPVVHPNFIGLGKIDRFAGVSSKPGDRVDHFARSQVDDFDGPLVLPGNEQALSFDVYRHMVEVALNIRQRNALDLFQRRAGLTPRRWNQDYAQSPENSQVGFHPLAPQWQIFPSLLPFVERPRRQGKCRPVSFVAVRDEARGYPSPSPEPTLCRATSSKLRLPGPEQSDLALSQRPPRVCWDSPLSRVHPGPPPSFACHRRELPRQWPRASDDGRRYEDRQRPRLWRAAAARQGPSCAPGHVPTRTWPSCPATSPRPCAASKCPACRDCSQCWP